MGTFSKERDALGVAEEFGLNEGGLFVLAGAICVLEKVDEFAFGDVAVFALVNESEARERAESIVPL